MFQDYFSWIGVHLIDYEFYVFQLRIMLSCVKETSIDIYVAT